jgi:hypothetical protein
MATLWFIVTTLSLVVLEANAANLAVGQCVTIESNKWRGRFLFDSGNGGGYWVYTGKTPTLKTHHWKVKSHNGNILKFENMQHQNRCLCERLWFPWTMFAATCECKDGAKDQEWDLKGQNNVARFMRPDTGHYNLEDCPSTSCAYIMDNKPSYWVLQNVNC